MGKNKVKYDNEAKEQLKLRINENEGSYDVTINQGERNITSLLITTLEIEVFFSHI